MYSALFAVLCHKKLEEVTLIEYSVVSKMPSFTSSEWIYTIEGEKGSLPDKAGKCQ